MSLLRALNRLLVRVETVLLVAFLSIMIVFARLALCSAGI